MVYGTQTAQAEQAKQGPEVRSPEEAVGSLVCHLKKYAEENPASAALWCVGIGFVLGWKLKPW
jgi:hypothetical protein